MSKFHHRAQLALGLLACLLLVLLAGACRQAPPTPATNPATAAAKPAQAVRQLTKHLHDNNLAAFAREAVPPVLHAQLESAWRQGRTRWPLEELPFERRLPAMLKSLAAAGAEARLQAVFDRQFAHAEAQIHGAANSLGLFGTQYLQQGMQQQGAQQQSMQQQDNYSDDERQHYVQLIAAASRWGAQAPLGDPVRARASIAELTAAARKTGLTSSDAFVEAGMDASLRRLGPFAAALKRSLARYGWNLDTDLAAMEVTLQRQTGDTAQVRMRYTLAGQPIDTVVAMRRVAGRWYVADHLRHAQAALDPPVITPNNHP